MANAASQRPDPSVFRAFTVKHAGLVTRIVTTIQVTVAFDPRNPPIPVPTSTSASALWDTGATGSAITRSLAARLGLSPTGMRVVKHAGGSSPSNTYLVNLHLPNGVAIIGVPVTEFAETTDFEMIVGMDIIIRGDFAVTNTNGQTWVSFRVPSIQGIDYVQEAQKMRYAGVGRNDPCPCGKIEATGKPIKFKKCHGRT